MINCISISSRICLASAFRRMCFPKALCPRPFQKLPITHFSNRCKIFIQDAGMWRGQGAINTVCFGRKVISDLRDGAANCSLSSETFPGKIYHSEVASRSFDFFCYLQLCPALPLSINIIKDSVQILSVSQNEKTFFDWYLDTGEQGKQTPFLMISVEFV